MVSDSIQAVRTTIPSAAKLRSCCPSIFAPSFQSTPKITRAMPTDGLLDQLLAEPFGKRAQAQ
jgi:hypothetical protein